VIGRAALARGDTRARKAVADVMQETADHDHHAVGAWYRRRRPSTSDEEQTGNSRQARRRSFSASREGAQPQLRSGQSPYRLMMLTSVDGEFYKAEFSPEGDRSGVDVPKESSLRRLRSNGTRPSDGALPTGASCGLNAARAPCNCCTRLPRVGCASRGQGRGRRNWKEFAPCTKLGHAGHVGFVARGRRGNGIRYDWH